MSGRCRHRLVICHGWHRTDGYWYEAPYLARHQADAAVCQTCGTWLPLGHSDETPERVAVEIRAAGLAHGVDNEHEFTDCEWMGWSGDEAYVTGPPMEWHTVDDLSPRQLDRWHVGRLAYEIAIHEDETP